MKRVNNLIMLAIAVLLFLISYNLDEQVNLFFKSAKFGLLDAVLSIVTNFGAILIAILLIPSITLYRKGKKIAHLLLVTFAISFILAFVAKLIVLRQRPIEAFTYPFINIINYSFPSMHAMVVFALLPILVEYLQKQKWFFIIFSFLVGFSRIYFGFHFLSDVVFGALFGYFIGTYLLELYEKGKLWKK